MASVPCGMFISSLPVWDSANMLPLSRFIPNREGQDLQASYSLLHEDGCPTTPSKVKKRAPHGELHFQKSKPGCTYSISS